MTRMTPLSWWTVVALLGAAMLATGCGDDDDGTAPRIDSLAPASAAAGTEIDLLGVRFCGPAAADVGAGDTCAAPPAGFVTFGVTEGVPEPEPPVRAPVKAWKPTRITVTVPAGAQPGVQSVVVTVNGVPSSPRDFTVLE